MKSEDITAIATSTIAVTLILGTVFYFKQEGEKIRLREERVEQMQLKIYSIYTYLYQFLDL